MNYPVLDESQLVAGDWIHSCGTVLLGARVHHSVHDGPFPLSGHGEVRVEIVPYCPTCQPTPSPNGSPIR